MDSAAQAVARCGDIPPVCDGPPTDGNGSDSQLTAGGIGASVMCVTSAPRGSSVPFPLTAAKYARGMEPNEFVEKLLSETSLDAIDYASDVERILAEQVVYLRERVRTLDQGSVLGTHEVIRQLYARLEDKDRQIEALHEEVAFLRQHVGG